MDQDRSYNKISTNEQQIRYEFTNTETIVLRKNKVFWKAVGNSAVMLKIFGAKTKIHSYYNAYYSQEVLEMSLHAKNIEDVKKWLEKQSVEILRDDNRYYIIKLKTPVSSKRIKIARKSKEISGEVTENILYKHRHSTPLLKAVKDVFTEAGTIVGRMPKINGAVLGEFILRNVLELQQLIRSYSRSRECTKADVQKITDKVDDILGLLLLVPNFLEQASNLMIIGRRLEFITKTISKTTELVNIVEKSPSELS